MSDYSELKRLAELCPWEKIEGFEYDASAGKAFCLGDGPHNHLLTTFDQRFQKYIEAANPAAVLALIAENERLDGECEGCPMAIAEELRKERDQLKAENDAMRTALEKISAYAPCSGIKDPGFTKMHMGILARDAIAAAMSQGEQS